MDNQEYQVYQEPNQQPQKSGKGLAIASLVCGLVCFFCINPCYLLSFAACITGGIALGKNTEGKGMAIAGIILGIASIVIQVIVDICLIPFTFGLTFLF